MPSVETDALLLAYLALAVPIVLALFIAPSIVAFICRHPDRYVILALNLGLGATGIGWLVAVIWAAGDLSLSLANKLARSSNYAEQTCDDQGTIFKQGRHSECGFRNKKDAAHPMSGGRIHDWPKQEAGGILKKLRSIGQEHGLSLSQALAPASRDRLRREGSAGGMTISSAARRR